MDSVVSAKIDGEVLTMLEKDANTQFSSISAVVRQIVYKHYGFPPIPAEEKIEIKGSVKA